MQVGSYIFKISRSSYYVICQVKVKVKVTGAKCDS